MAQNSSNNTDLNNTITVMPESGGQTLCLALDGQITRKSHQEYLRAGLENILKNHDSYNLLLYYTPGYQGWDPAAADSSMQSILDYGRKARKLAFVNPSEKKIMQHKMTPDLFGGETRFFDAHELQEAISWVKS